jgi:hypothetical protein
MPFRGFLLLSSPLKEAAYDSERAGGLGWVGGDALSDEQDVAGDGGGHFWWSQQNVVNSENLNDNDEKDKITKNNPNIVQKNWRHSWEYSYQTKNINWMVDRSVRVKRGTKAGAIYRNEDGSFPR